jgi:hypothetical protein
MSFSMTLSRWGRGWGRCGRRRRRRTRIVCTQRGDRLIAASMGHACTGIGKHLRFRSSGSVIFAPAAPVKPVHRDLGSPIPRIECVGIGLPQLFRRSQAIGEFFKGHVGLERGHSPDQHHQHPFHLAFRALCPDGDNGELFCGFRHGRRLAGKTAPCSAGVRGRVISSPLAQILAPAVQP